MRLGDHGRHGVRMNSNTRTPMAAALLLAVLLGVAWVGGMVYTLTAWAAGS